MECHTRDSESGAEQDPTSSFMSQLVYWPLLLIYIPGFTVHFFFWKKSPEVILRGRHFTK